MSFLLLHQTLVVSGNFHGQILFGLDQELHPCFTLLQEGLLLQQEGLKFAEKKQSEQIKRSNFDAQLFQYHMTFFSKF